MVKLGEWLWMHLTFGPHLSGLPGVFTQAHSKYAPYFLADYITAAAELHLDAVANSAFPPLEEGIHALVRACSSFDLQQLHVRLSAGLGGIRQAMLTQLREQHERTKYTGHV